MVNLSDLYTGTNILKVHGSLAEETKISVSTDSRSYSNQSCFVAITGANYNAFNFIRPLYDKGCRIFVFTSSTENSETLKNYNDFQGSIFLEVKSSEVFLQELGNLISLKFQSLGKKIICISGSNGKTTTKEMLSFILNNCGVKSFKTQRNNNNQLGVPLTLLQALDDDYSAGIVELGSNHPGEIPLLTKIAFPQVGVTTNIGKTHLEFFGDLDKVFKEEAFLYESVFEKGKDPLFFKNADDEYLMNLEDKESVISFGFNGVDYKFSFDSINKVMHILHKGENYEVANANITGQHNFFNLSVATIISYQVFGLDFNQVTLAASRFKPTSNRSEWLKKDNCKIFLDAYNANPSSMQASLEGFLGEIPNNVEIDDILFVLGDMNELGDKSSLYHEQIGEFLKKKNLQNVAFVGKFSSAYDKGFGLAGHKFDSSSQFNSSQFKDCFKKYKYVFIKGSRSLQLESILDIT